MLNKICLRAAAVVTGGVVAAALITPAVGATPAGSAPAPAATAPQSAATAPQSAAPAERPVLTSPYGTARSRVSGTWGRAGTVRGWFVPRRVEMRDGRLMAIGRLHAVLVRPNGTVRGVADKRIVIPVKKIEGVGLARLPASCQILNLVLGPLDLNLLGLEVHLNRVVLNIEATPGPGNLLGNLLCAIAGLLDNTGVLREIGRILNSVLAILRL